MKLHSIVLTHGYFLSEDEKERQIMKPYPPLGLLYLSAYLKAAGRAVEVFDSTFGDRRTLYDLFDASPAGVVGIYTNLMTRRSVLDIVEEAKRHRWHVVLGGPEAANYVDEYLRAGADVIVFGEGEAAFLELLILFDTNTKMSLASIDGIAFRDEQGMTVRTRSRALLPDLDALPWPDRESIDHAPYLQAWKQHHGSSSINLITARGCPYRCNWCSHSVFGYSHRRRTPSGVADEVQWIVDRYDPDRLWYADDVFTISHPWLQTYNAELKRRGIHRPFETITRADRLQTPAAARALQELGCYRIWIGSESGSQRILDAMERGVTVEQVRRAVRLAKDHGMEVGMFLMWGYESEELEDIAATVEHVKVTNPDIFFTTVSYPIKGTPYFEKVRERLVRPALWQDSSDRDYVIAGRRGKEYYRLADQWLRNAVEAERSQSSDPQLAATFFAKAEAARVELMTLHNGEQRPVA